MKYDIKICYSIFCGPYGYFITADGEPIHVLPDCKSQFEGHEFMEWWYSECETTYRRHPEDISPKEVKIFFAEFRKQRDEKMEDQKPKPQAEDEYMIRSYYPASNCTDKSSNTHRYRIEHIDSSNMVSRTFESQELAEGFLKWWYHPDSELYVDDDKILPVKEIHRCSLYHVESVYNRYKATLEKPVGYRCPECGDKSNHPDKSPHECYADDGEGERLYLKCTCCGAESGRYPKTEQPNESWIMESDE